MNYVEPIRYIEDIYKMYDYLSKRSERDYLFFKFAIHTGIKLNDLLSLFVRDIVDDSFEVIHFWDKHPEQHIRVMIPETLRQELKDYVTSENLDCDDLLFQSKRTHNSLSQQQAYRIINRAANDSSIEHVGLTTLRKTFAYHAYKAGISISIIQKYLGHQTSYETMKFIGISKQEVNTTIALNL